MKSSTSKLASAAILSLALACPGIPAFAQDSHFFAGAAVGASNKKDGCDDLPGGISCDHKDTGWKLFGGYQFNKYLGAELGYTDLGKVKASGGGLSARAKIDGFELTGVGTIPLVDKLSAYGKLGFIRSDVDTSAKFAGVKVSEKDHSTDLTFGLGLRYDFTNMVGARLEWQHYDNVGNSSTGKSDVNLLSVGVLFKF
jgi:OOP family OmpA-OmpF porin